MKISASLSKVGCTVRQKYEFSLSPTNEIVEGHSTRASGERAACSPAVPAPGESASLLASASIIPLPSFWPEIEPYLRVKHRGPGQAPRPQSAALRRESAGRVGGAGQPGGGV